MLYLQQFPISPSFPPISPHFPPISPHFPPFSLISPHFPQFSHFLETSQGCCSVWASAGVMVACLAATDAGGAGKLCTQTPVVWSIPAPAPG